MQRKVGETLGSEQALAPVREPDTFSEGAWDKVPKTKGTFDLILQYTTSLTYHKGYTYLLCICVKMFWTNLKEKFWLRKLVLSTKDVSLSEGLVQVYSQFVALMAAIFFLVQLNVNFIGPLMFNEIYI